MSAAATDMKRWIGNLIVLVASLLGLGLELVLRQF
jgi:hypothetical protein